MIKIVSPDQSIVCEVTHGAFEELYKRQGYVPYKEKVASKEESVKGSDTHVETGDELFLKELAEKPIAHWNKDEVIKFAKLSGIDIAGTHNIREAKSIINDHLHGMEEAAVSGQLQDDETENDADETQGE